MESAQLSPGKGSLRRTSRQSMRERIDEEEEPEDVIDLRVKRLQSRQKTRWDPEIKFEREYSKIVWQRERHKRVEHCFVSYKNIVDKEYNRDLIVIWALLFMFCNLFTALYYTRELIVVLSVTALGIHYETRIKQSFKNEPLYSVDLVENFSMLVKNPERKRNFLKLTGLQIGAMAINSSILFLSLNRYYSFLYVFITSSLFGLMNSFDFLANGKYIQDHTKRQRGSSNIDEALINLLSLSPVGLIKYLNAIICYLPFISLIGTVFLAVEFSFSTPNLTSDYFVLTGIVTSYAVLYKGMADICESLALVYFKRCYFFKQEYLIRDIELLVDVYDLSVQMQYEVVDFLIQIVQKDRNSIIVQKVVHMLETNAHFQQQIFSPIYDFQKALKSLKSQIDQFNRPSGMKDSMRQCIAKINKLVSMSAILQSKAILHLNFLIVLGGHEKRVHSVENSLHDILSTDRYLNYLNDQHAALPSHLRKMLKLITDK